MWEKQCKFNDSVVGNKNAGEKFSLNLIKVQVGIRPCRWENQQNFNKSDALLFGTQEYIF